MFGVSPRSRPPHPLRQEVKEIEWKWSRRRHEWTAEAQQAAGRLNLAPWGKSQHLWEAKNSCNRKLLTWDLSLMFDTQSFSLRIHLGVYIPMNNWLWRRADDPYDDSVTSSIAWSWDLLSGASCCVCKIRSREDRMCEKVWYETYVTTWTQTCSTHGDH